MTEAKIYNRDNFLQNLSKQLGRTERRTEVTPFVFEVNPQYEILKNTSKDTLVEIFKEESKKVNTDVYETDVHGLQSKVKDVLQNYHAKKVMTTNDHRFKEYKVFDLNPEDQVELSVWDQEKDIENIKLAEQADAGVVFADYGLAESGTVVVIASDLNGRSVSLLPTAFVAIIPKSSIVPRFTQVADIVTKQDKEHISSCIKFISGPSNSGDIEMNLVVGVHGPIKASYIIVTDR